LLLSTNALFFKEEKLNDFKRRQIVSASEDCIKIYGRHSEVAQQKHYMVENMIHLLAPAFA
jgi:hypothetical protein